MDFAKALSAIFQVSKGTIVNVSLITSYPAGMSCSNILVTCSSMHWLLDHLQYGYEDEDSSIIVRRAQPAK